jgi:hypothetical protein
MQQCWQAGAFSSTLRHMYYHTICCPPLLIDAAGSCKQRASTFSHAHEKLINARFFVFTAGSCKLPAGAAAAAGKPACAALNPVTCTHHLTLIFLVMLQAPASCLLMQRQQQASLRVQRSTLPQVPTI